MQNSSWVAEFHAVFGEAELQFKSMEIVYYAAWTQLKES